MKISLKTITPELARTYLDINNCNRPLSNNLVQKYADDMQNNLWSQTGEAIKLSKTTLLDGQHRLAAIVKLNKPQTLLVVEELDDQCFHDIDTGRKRSLADVLNIEGYSQNKILATLVRAAYIYNRYGLEVMLAKSNHKTRHINNKTLSNFVKNDPDILAALEYVKTNIKGNPFISRSSFAILYYLFAKKDLNMAQEFIYQYATGEDLKADNPILSLRKKIINIRSNRGSWTSKEVILNLSIKTWNATRSGKKLSKLYADSIPNKIL